jgi:hypothetical protein
MAEVDDCIRAPHRLLDKFYHAKLLRSKHAPCMRCGGHQSEHEDERYWCGVRLRCSRCHGDSSLRAGSHFPEVDLTPFQLARVLLAFDLRLDNKQAAAIACCSGKQVGAMYKRLRERCQAYLFDHPIRFSADEIVEIDELYLKPLRGEVDEYEERHAWQPVIGLISRDTGAVALEIAPDHSTPSMRAAITPHLPAEDTRVITDEHKSFDFLNERYQHDNALKEHRGSASWPLTYSTRAPGREPHQVHTNTIEGYWSQLRTYLHTSHGWPAHYLPLYLSECMFRSLHLSLLTLLQLA